MYQEFVVLRMWFREEAKLELGLGRTMIEIVDCCRLSPKRHRINIMGEEESRPTNTQLPQSEYRGERTNNWVVLTRVASSGVTIPRRFVKSNWPILARSRFPDMKIGVSLRGTQYSTSSSNATCYPAIYTIITSRDELLLGTESECCHGMHLCQSCAIHSKQGQGRMVKSE